ncbi:MAG: glycosyltransferase [Fischerella sp. CENA71]|nr:glycosyltransferase [Fischerella sp. CENA71]
MEKFSFLFLSANNPWTYGLAEALAQNHLTHVNDFYDWKTYRLLQPSWPSQTTPSLLTRSMHVLPTGYAGKLERLFRFYLQQLIQQWCRRLERVSGEYPWVIASHPYLAPWVRKVPQDKLIYYNYDDYLFSQPHRKEQEKELIERASITICASHSQFITLRKLYPHRADRIHHYPHGFVDSFLNPQPKNLTEPMSVGYIGNLTERVDWKLVYELVQACPEVKFVFVGGLDKEEIVDWRLTRKAVLALPNVQHITEVPSEQVAKYYWSFAVNWIPYSIENRFNQASCPTKIMDGIASGRPLISTDIPECRLYPEWITIVHSPEDAIAQIHNYLALSKRPEAYGRSLKQLEFARQHTWQVRAQTLKDLLTIS